MQTEWLEVKLLPRPGEAAANLLLQHVGVYFFAQPAAQTLGQSRGK